MKQGVAAETGITGGDGRPRVRRGLMREKSDRVRVRAPRSAEEALAYLYRDPFPNASLIAAVERGAAGGVQVRVAEDGAVRGVLVVAPGPDGTRSTGLDTDCAGVAEQLLRALRSDEQFQFGLHRAEAVTALKRVCVATPTGVMLGFRHSGPGPQVCDLALARELTRDDERVVQLARDEPFLQSYLQAVGRRTRREPTEVRAFGVVSGGKLLARCLTTWAPQGIERQIGTVWSVYTEPETRGRGLGRAVVAAATAAILASGRTARYFAFSDNIPSLRICRSLGYCDDHAVHYFWVQRRG